MNALKGLVIGMGFLIVIGMIALGYGLYYKSNHPDFKLFAGSPSAPVTASAPGIPQPALPAGHLPSFGDVSVLLPKDGELKQMVAEGGRLFLYLSALDGGRVVVLDLASGAVLGTVHLKH